MKRCWVRLRGRSAQASGKLRVERGKIGNCWASKRRHLPLTLPIQGVSMFRVLTLAFSIGLMVGSHFATAQTPPAAPRPTRPTPPTRDPNTPGYVAAKDLPDGTNPPVNVDGNFILGPTHTAAPEMTVQDGVPQGTIATFTMESADSKIYPGIFREPNTLGQADPDDPAKMIVTTSHSGPYTRRVTVYVPKQYVPGTVAPFIVGAD